MAIAHAQAMGSGVTTATGGTHSIAVTTNQLTAGNVLTLVMTDQGDSPTSITDSKANTWTIKNDLLSAGLDVCIATCTPVDSAHRLTNTDTISVVCSNTGFAVLWFMDEWSGLTETLDAAPAIGTTASISVTTVTSPCLMMACYGLFHSGAVTFTPTSGWTGSSVQDVGAPGSYHLAFQWQVTSSAGSESTSGASFSAAQIAATMVALQAIGGTVGGRNRALTDVGT